MTNKKVQFNKKLRNQNNTIIVKYFIILFISVPLKWDELNN